MTFPNMKLVRYICLVIYLFMIVQCTTCFIAATHIELIKMEEINCITFVHMWLYILIFTICSELQKVLFLAPSVCGFLCVWNISGTAEWICTKFTRKTCLVPLMDKFEGQGQRWRSQGQKRHFSALLAACVWFMFIKTSLASSYRATQLC